jgi:hypothetical protein
MSGILRAIIARAGLIRMRIGNPGPTRYWYRAAESSVQPMPTLLLIRKSAARPDCRCSKRLVPGKDRQGGGPNRLGMIRRCTPRHHCCLPPDGNGPGEQIVHGGSPQGQYRQPVASFSSAAGCGEPLSGRAIFKLINPKARFSTIKSLRPLLFWVFRAWCSNTIMPMTISPA